MGLSWWHHQRKHQSSASLAICAGNSPVTGEFPAHRPVTRSFEVFFDLCLNKRLSKQSWGWWFETPSHPLWRYCNGYRSFATVHWHGTGCTGSCRNLWCRQWWKCPQNDDIPLQRMGHKIYTEVCLVLFCCGYIHRGSPGRESVWFTYLYSSVHDDVMIWTHFPHYWSFMRGIHWSPMNSSPKEPVVRSFDIFVEVSMNQGPVSIRKTVFPGMGIPMLKIRRPVGRLIFNMGIAIPSKTVFLIETAPSIWRKNRVAVILVISFELDLSYDCPSASEGDLEDMDKMCHYQTLQWRHNEHNDVSNYRHFVHSCSKVMGFFFCGGKMWHLFLRYRLEILCVA